MESAPNGNGKDKVKHITIEDKINNYLLYIKRQTGDDVNISKIAETLSTPYGRNISMVLVNMGLVKYNSKGKYTIEEFEVTPTLVNSVISECRELGRTYNKNSNTNKKDSVKKEELKPEPKPINPFGFDGFDAIMVEKGTMVIGEYLLEGSFTITKRNKEE